MGWLQSNGRRFETREEPMFQFESEGRKQPMTQLKAVRLEKFLLPRWRVNAFVSIWAFA